MSNNYKPTKWLGGKTIGTAQVMNNIEQGISNAHDKLDDFDIKISTLEQYSYNVDNVDFIDFKKIVGEFGNANMKYKILYFPKGVYYIPHATFNEPVIIIGDGKESILKVRMWHFGNEVVIKNIQIMKDETSKQYSYSLRVQSIDKDVYFDNVTFTNSSDNIDKTRSHIRVFSAKNVSIINCVFYNLGNTLDKCHLNVVGNKFYMNFNNEIESCLHPGLDSTGVITNNEFWNSFDAPIDFYPNGHDFIVSDNTFIDNRNSILTIKAILRDIGSDDEILNGSTNRHGNIYNIVFSNNIIKQKSCTFYGLFRLTTDDIRSEKSDNNIAYYPTNIVINNNLIDLSNATSLDNQRTNIFRVCGVKDVTIKNNIIKPAQIENSIVYFTNENNIVMQKTINLSILDNEIISSTGKAVTFIDNSVNETDGLIICKNRFISNSNDKCTLVFVRNLYKGTSIILKDNLSINTNMTSSPSHIIGNISKIYIEGEDITDIDIRCDTFIDCTIKNSELQKIINKGMINNFILINNVFKRKRSWIGCGVYNNNTINSCFINNNSFFNISDDYCIYNAGTITNAYINSSNNSISSKIWNTSTGYSLPVKIIDNSNFKS